MTHHRWLTAWILFALSAISVSGALVWLGVEAGSGRGELEPPDRVEQRKIALEAAALEAHERRLGELRGEALVRTENGQPGHLALEVLRYESLDLDLGWLERREDRILIRGQADDLDPIAGLLEDLKTGSSWRDVELRSIDRPEGPGPGVAGEAGYGFEIGLTAVALAGLSGSTRLVLDPAAIPVGLDGASSSGGLSPVRPDRAAQPVRERMRALVGPPSSDSPSLPKSSLWGDLAIDQIEILAVVESSLGPMARARGRPGDEPGLLLQGDGLFDGEVGRIGFLSSRLAVVRFKRWHWPPRWDRPYEEILRVVGWDRLRDPGALGGALSEAGQEPLEVRGPEAQAWWPQGWYRNPGQRLVERVAGGRPRVDLYAATFYELHGVLPWRHPQWNGEGWRVGLGPSLSPWRTVQTVAGHPPEPRDPRDPFRSLWPPWVTLEGFQHPQSSAELLIDDLEIEEIYWTPSGPVTEIFAAGWFQPWILRPGDRLWDGEVVSIQPCREVVFRQAVSDPTALKPFREVVKRRARRATALGVVADFGCAARALEYPPVSRARG